MVRSRFKVLAFFPLAAYIRMLFQEIRGERSSMAEHQAVALGVVGSNPIAHPHCDERPHRLEA